jgi:plastocyanin
MAFRPGFLRSQALLAALVFAFPLAASLRADQTVQVGPGNAFSPATVTVAPGEAVIWSFQAFHTATSDATTGPEVWDSGFLSTGTFSHTFMTPGSHPYYCQVHSAPGGTAMNGVVVVSGLGVTPTATQTPTVTPTVPPGPPSPSPTPPPTPTVTPTVPPGPPSPSLTPPPSPTSPPGGPVPTPAPPSSSIPTLDSTGTILFALVLAAVGFAVLKLAGRH